MEAATMLGSVLAIAGIFTNVPVLKPNSMQFQPIQSQQTKVSFTVSSTNIAMAFNWANFYFRKLCLVVWLKLRRGNVLR